MNDKNSGKESSLWGFFGQPWVGIAGLFVGIISITRSVYIYLVSRETPKLTYLVNPAKATVVRTGQTSRLAVEFDGKSVKSDVTAAQIAFWNAGKKPIRSDAVLRPFVIKTGAGQPIMEAKLRKPSRDVVHIALDTSHIDIGELGISWNILEQNDGGVLQIIYAGDEKVDIGADAVVEGQPKIGSLDPKEKSGSGAVELVLLAVLVTAITVLLFWLRKRFGVKFAHRPFL